MNFSKTIDGMKSYNVFGMTADADRDVFFQDERGQTRREQKKAHANKSSWAFWMVEDYKIARNAQAS